MSPLRVLLGGRGTDSGPRLVDAANDPPLAIAYAVLPKRRNSAIKSIRPAYVPPEDPPGGAAA